MRKLPPTTSNITRAASLYMVLVLVLTILRRFRPAREGPRALTAVFAHYLWLPLPFLDLLRRDWRRLRSWLLASIVYVAPVGLRMLRRRSAASTRSFTAMTWNILYSNPRFDDLLAFLATKPADIIAIQEFTRAHVRRLADDPLLARHYPHNVVWAYGRGGGMGLLSKYPILQHGALESPPTIWARLDLGQGREITVVNAHPTFFPPKMEEDDPNQEQSSWDLLRRIVDPRFLQYATSHRDNGIANVRRLIDERQQRGEVLLVAGDFNVTERELAYADLTAGLHDAQACVGELVGTTWKPEWLAGVPFTLLRIDYLLSSPALRPLRAVVDRTPRGSDHCPVLAEFALPD